MRNQRRRDVNGSGQGRLCAILVMALLSGACHQVQPTTVILVRHAERPSGADPDLNEKGRARAESLAVSLKQTRVDAILHTQYKRTQQTAQPLASMKGITPQIVPAAGPESVHAMAVVEAVNALKGRTIIYVGHSNTVPGVIQRLGIVPAPEISDSEYDHLFIVVLDRNGQASMVRVRFGER